MATIVSGITTLVNASVTWLTAIVNGVTAEGNELLLFYCLASFIGIAVGLLMRFVRR